MVEISEYIEGRNNDQKGIVFCYSIISDDYKYLG